MAARCPATLSLFDWTPRPTQPTTSSPRARAQRTTTQADHLARVSSRIGAVVLAFCAERVGREFVAQDLRDHVAHHELAAPASPDRILRLLRQGGLVDYVVVDRRKSLYRIDAVHPAPPLAT